MRGGGGLEQVEYPLGGDGPGVGGRVCAHRTIVANGRPRAQALAARRPVSSITGAGNVPERLRQEARPTQDERVVAVSATVELSRAPA